MTNMDLESIRQFVLSDEEIRKYFLSLAGKENSGQSARDAGESPDRIPMQRVCPENILENYDRPAGPDYAALRKELKAAQEKADALERECGRLREAVSQEQAQKNAVMEQLEVFAPIDSAMKIYKSLDEKSKAATKNIFRDTSPDAFISCGAQKDSLANLWDYGRTLAAYGSEECRKIDMLFCYFVSLYNLTFEQPVYTLIEPQEGDRFDEDIHVCLTRGKRISSVSDVLLRGYRVNGKTVNKALVK